jgi:hypothetical protein
MDDGEEVRVRGAAGEAVGLGNGDKEGAAGGCGLGSKVQPVSVSVHSCSGAFF